MGSPLAFEYRREELKMMGGGFADDDVAESYLGACAGFDQSLRHAEKDLSDRDVDTSEMTKKRYDEEGGKNQRKNEEKKEERKKVRKKKKVK